MATYLGADHRGFELKEIIKNFLSGQEIDIEDLGNDHYDEGDDYPEIAARVARKVAADPKQNRGILICGSGVGVDVVANKFKGVRSALVFCEGQAIASRRDDDANVLCLPADFIDEDEAQRVVLAWLNANFSGEEKHKRRIKEISELEKTQ